VGRRHNAQPTPFQDVSKLYGGVDPKTGQRIPMPPLCTPVTPVPERPVYGSIDPKTRLPIPMPPIPPYAPVPATAPQPTAEPVALVPTGEYTLALSFRDYDALQLAQVLDNLWRATRGPRATLAEDEFGALPLELQRFYTPVLVDVNAHN
jgi:hypothetical protein